MGFSYQSAYRATNAIKAADRELTKLARVAHVDPDSLIDVSQGRVDEARRLAGEVGSHIEKAQRYARSVSDDAGVSLADAGKLMVTIRSTSGMTLTDQAAAWHTDAAKAADLLSRASESITAETPRGSWSSFRMAMQHPAGQVATVAAATALVGVPIGGAFMVDAATAPDGPGDIEGTEVVQLITGGKLADQTSSDLTASAPIGEFDDKQLAIDAARNAVAIATPDGEVGRAMYVTTFDDGGTWYVMPTDGSAVTNGDAFVSVGSDEPDVSVDPELHASFGGDQDVIVTGAGTVIDFG